MASAVRPSMFSLARMSVTSSGAGTITLGAAVTSFLTFDLAGASTGALGNWVQYAIADTTQTEQGFGLYTSSALTLTRGSSLNGLKSTNGNSPINMTNGAQVLITPHSHVLNDITGVNRIVNPGMVIDQRNAGNAVSVAASSVYDFTSVDRWAVNAVGGTATVQRTTTSLPSGFSHALMFTGGAGVTAMSVEQPIEARNVSDLTNQLVTHSVMATASNLTSMTWEIFASTGVNSFSDDVGGTPVSSGAFTLTTGWQGFSATLNASANAGNGMIVRYSVGASTGTWLLTGVQFEKGAVPTDYETRLLGDEIRCCERYYEKAQALEIASTVVGGDGFVFFPTGGMTVSTAAIVGQINWRTEKFANPTVVIRPFTNSSAVNTVSQEGGNDLLSGSGTPINQNPKSVNIRNNSSSPITLVGNDVGFIAFYSAESELM